MLSSLVAPIVLNREGSSILGIVSYIGLFAIFAWIAYQNFSIGLFVTVCFLHILQSQFEKKVVYFLMGSFAFWLFFFHYSYAENENIHEHELHLTIQFIEQPVIDGNKLSAYVKTETGEKLQFNYYIGTEHEKNKLKINVHPGVTCRVSGILQTPREPTNPNAFNYRTFLRTQKIDYMYTAHSIQSCQMTESSWYMKLLQFRQESMDKIHQSFPQETAPFVNALLFGANDQMDESTRKAYQHLGLSHLLAISGLHVTIISGCVYYILLRFGMSRERVRQILLMFLPVYGIIAGGSPSVVRSVLMAWIILFLAKWRSLFHPFDALALTFLFSLFVNPYLIYHVGFQLSYVVTAGIILSNPLLQKMKNWLTSGFFIALLSQIIALPILLYHFYEFSLFGVFLNIFYVPLYSVIILPLCFLVFLLLLFIPSITNPFIICLHFLISVANKGAEWFYHLDILTIVLGKTSLFMFVVFYSCFIIGLIILEKYWFRHKKFLLIFFIPFFIQYSIVNFSPVGEVVFLDVGQGDSVVIRLPFNQGNYLIDTGGTLTFEQEEWKQRSKSFDPGENIVIPFLKSRGITTIDKIVLTHGDIDHLGSAQSIIAEMKVKELIVGMTNNKKDIEKRTIQYALEKNVQVTEVYSGMQWNKGKHKFYITSPKKHMPASNDQSVVIYALMGGKRWLFTGDLEKEGEQRMIQQYPNLSVDILKVGHHGSNTSTTEPFLKTIQPEVAIISAGRNNRYGHPHQEVLDLLDVNNIFVYRTDRHGAITYRYLLNHGIFYHESSQ